MPKPDLTVARPQDTCQQCGSVAYADADMVGEVCPECWEENQLVRAVAEAEQAAEAAKDRLAERRKERSELNDGHAKVPASPVANDKPSEKSAMKPNV